MRGKTNTGSEIAFKREQSSTSAVNLGGNSDIKPTSNTLFDFYRINTTIYNALHCLNDLHCLYFTMYEHTILF